MRIYDPTEVAARICAWEAESGLRGYEVAEKAGIKPGYYSEIRTATKPGTVEVLASIAGVFGKTIGDLFPPSVMETATPEDEAAAAVDAMPARVRAHLRAIWEDAERRALFEECLQRYAQAPDELQKAFVSLLRAIPLSSDEATR